MLGNSPFKSAAALASINILNNVPARIGIKVIKVGRDRRGLDQYRRTPGEPNPVITAVYDALMDANLVETTL